MNTDNYWIYILLCDNDSFYTGYTTDLLRRYQQHLAGKCKYTRSFKPLCIAQAWRLSGSKSQAMKVENAVKKLSRTAKEALIHNSAAFAETWHLTPLVKI